jgi:uncharacterized protein YecE (DUF72 family)
MRQLSLLDEPEPEPDPAPGCAGRSPEAAALAAAAASEQLTELGARLDPRLRLGTSSWAFPGWAGLVYGGPLPKPVLSRDGLTAYGRHPLLRTVGVDSGFYAPLDAERLARWAAQVPTEFRFLVKAPASVTDRFARDARGRPRELNPGFLDPALAIEQAVAPYQRGLGDRAGILLFQFAPMGHQVSANPRRFAEDLYRFLKRLPRGPSYAVELRDTALLTPDLAAALHHGGAMPGLASHPRLPRLPRQQALFSAVADGPLVIRWLLRHGLGYEEAKTRYQPFDRLAEPDPETRAAVIALIREALAQGREVFVIVNNKAEGSSPLTLVQLARELVAASA